MAQWIARQTSDYEGAWHIIYLKAVGSSPTSLILLPFFFFFILREVHCVKGGSRPVREKNRGSPRRDIRMSA